MSQFVDDAIAKYVMGWERKDHPAFGSLLVSDTGLVRGDAVQSWSPSTDMGDTWEAVERMRQKHWTYDLSEDQECDLFHHARLGMLIPERWEWVRATQRTPQRALCHAMLRAVRMERDGKV